MRNDTEKVLNTRRTGGHDNESHDPQDLCDLIIAKYTKGQQKSQNKLKRGKQTNIQENVSVCA